MPAVDRFVIREVKPRVGDVNRWWRMLQFPQDQPTVDIVEQHIILI
jgi:hypothetical protein